MGGAWHAVPFAPGAFVINFGDLLSAWSRGAVRSTIHRVIYNSAAGAPRYSLPLFLHPNRGTMVRTPGGAAAGGSVGGFGRPVGDGSGDVVVDTYRWAAAVCVDTYRWAAAVCVCVLCACVCLCCVWRRGLGWVQRGTRGDWQWFGPA